MSNFKVLQNDSRSFARLGELELFRGKVRTPVFMPVGTHGAVRGVSAPELLDTRAEIMLANTYHVYNRPGVELVEKFGGLHRFTGWPKPILTDSGGFQVFSLAAQRKISDEKVVFRNNYNGDLVELNPEIVINAQERFGSDIMMVLDECPPAAAARDHIENALRRTTLWARRSQEARMRKELALFSIVQGGTHFDLRERSLRELLQIEKELQTPWEGIAIGGLSVGEKKENFIKALYEMRNMLPNERPRYLMGVGTPRDLVFAIACGVDMFDCVLPSRNGRHGIVMTRLGRMNILNAVHTEDERPIDTDCKCIACRNYSRAFIRHMLVIEDALGGRLCTIHNIQYFIDLMDTIRGHIADGTFVEFANAFISDPRTYFLGGEKVEAKYPETFL